MATPTTLPAAWTTGQVLASSSLNNLRGAFRVLQVVQTTWTSGQTSSSSTWADVTGGSASITPSDANSKVLCLVRVSGCDKYTNDTSLGLRLLRGATTIATLGLRIGFTNGTVRNLVGTSALVYLDSPATTSATTYKLQMNSYHNVATAAIGSDSPNDTHSIVLMEISA